MPEFIPVFKIIKNFNEWRDGVAIGENDHYDDEKCKECRNVFHKKTGRALTRPA
jgi:hypothetical protein